MADEVVKATGNPAQIIAEQALAVGEGRPFSPGVPLRPFDGYSTTPRSQDFPTGYNIAARPRRNERVSFDALRGLIDAYDVAQMCIWHRIDSIRSLGWSLVAAPGAEGEDLSRWQEIAMRVLYKPDRQHRFKSWLTKYLYDVLAFDAGAISRIRNNAGRAIGLEVIDGTTIAPLLDDYGRTPSASLPGEPQPAAYVQYIQGVPWSWLTTDDLIYEPFRPVSNSPYGKAPIEAILLNSNTDLRFQSYFMSRFTDGNIPEAFAGSPEGWSPDQIKEFQESWDALVYGDEAAKHQIKWVPNGTTFAWSNQKDFDEKFSLFLMRKTAAAFHVTPQDLGFTEDVNRATSETQVDNQFRVGDLPLIEHVQDILDGFLQGDLGLPLAFEFDTGQEKEDRLATAQADKIYVEMGALGVSEVRERVYGLSEPDGQLVPRYIMTTRSGPVPLSALYAVAGPVDEVNGAPEPGAALPHKPFAPIEGVTPQKPPDSPPLAVIEYPADNPQSAAAAAAMDAAPVVKGEGAAISVTAGTVATSHDLVGADDDEEEKRVDDGAEVAKAAELASFRRFARGRRSAGRWRDFTFTTVDQVTAHRLNDQGRAQVRKAEGLVVAAGLAVRAADTGRVLMLQRALDPADPAGGTWEFPGGHIEDGETPVDAALREWAEETGLILTGGQQTGGWASLDGIYRGFVWTIPAEADFEFGDRTHYVNPDDPDGDCVETLAWWKPEQIDGNTAVRPALRASLPGVLAALTPAAPAGDVLKAAGEPAAPKGPDGVTGQRKSPSTPTT